MNERRSPRVTIGPRGAAVLLAAIVAGASALALTWSFLVPIDQSPDEPQHLDYALAIRDGGGLFRARPFREDVVTYAHPWSAYLAERTGLDAVAHNRAARMEPGYGTRRYYRALDRDAPPLRSVRIERPPMLAAVYPYGYYLALAGWLKGAGLFTDRVTATFFAARGFSVALLAVSLVMGYLAARELRIGRGVALVATAIVGFFPMTSFVASYVQPDNLAMALVALGLYLALRAARRGGPIGDLAALGLCWGALLVTKPHVFACLAGASVPLLLTRIPMRRWPLAAGLLAWPCVPLWAAFAWVVKDCPLYYAAPKPGADLVATTTERLGRAFSNYLTGPTHEGFWGVFGWLDAPIEMGMSPRMGAILRALALAGTWAVVGLALLRIERVGSRLLRIAARGRARVALRVAASDPVMNVYFLFFAMMVYAFVRMDNKFAAQGRNWIPVMLPIVLLAIRYAPRGLTLRPGRRFASIALASALLIYAGVGSVWGLRAVKARYYLDDHRATRLVTLETAPTVQGGTAPDAGGGLRTEGRDAFLAYVLPGPRRVDGLEVALVVDTPDGRKANLSLSWADTTAPGSPEHTRSFDLPASPDRERRLFVPVGARINALRINPHLGPCRVEVRSLALRERVGRVAAR